MLRHCLGITQTKHQLFAGDEAACRKEAARLGLEQPAPRIPAKEAVRARVEVKRPDRKLPEPNVMADRLVMAHDGKRVIFRRSTRLNYFSGTEAECDAESERLQLVTRQKPKLRKKPPQR